MEHDRSFPINTFQIRTERYPWEKEEKEEENVFQAKEITCEKRPSGETLKGRVPGTQRI